jgi:hypothetical protein
MRGEPPQVWHHVVDSRSGGGVLGNMAFGSLFATAGVGRQFRARSAKGFIVRTVII